MLALFLKGCYMYLKFEDSAEIANISVFSPGLHRAEERHDAPSDNCWWALHE